MNRSEAIEIAGKCESFLNIPALYCEQIEKDLMENNYKEVIWFIIGRKEEIDKKKQQELERYKNIIDEATEYINKLSNEPNAFGHYGIDGNCKKYLLNILQGSDNSE